MIRKFVDPFEEARRAALAQAPQPPTTVTTRSAAKSGKTDVELAIDELSRRAESPPEEWGQIRFTAGTSKDEMLATLKALQNKLNGK